MNRDAALECALLEHDVRACEEHCAELERELAEAQAQLAKAVPLADLLELLEKCEQVAARAPIGVDVTSDVLDLLAWFCAARHAAASKEE